MLRVTSLEVHYGSIRALSDVSVDVSEGEIVSIVGANGAGKSTLLNTIGGVVRATGGSIEFEGTRLNDVAPEKRAHLGIALIPEDRGIFKKLTVSENLKIGLATGGTRTSKKAMAASSNCSRSFSSIETSKRVNFLVVSSKCSRSDGHSCQAQGFFWQMSLPWDWRQWWSIVSTKRFNS